MNYSLTQKRALALLLVGIALVFSLGLWGCSGNSDSPVSSDNSALSINEQVQLSKANPRVREVMAVLDRQTARVMQDPEVIGTAITQDENGEPVIMLLVTTENARGRAPQTIDGIKVKPFLTDRIVAMKGKPGGGGGVSHTAIQTPPIQLGTSGGWRQDLANGYCCGGTLGALIQVGGNKRILSNYHVFEADIVSGGNGTVATTGDFVIQPGLIDVGCNAGNAQNVATLVVTHSLPNSNVDCSSANIINGMVDPSGAILEIGTISSQTTGSFVGQAVKKSGRTTGLQRSSVAGYYATVSITYENECAGGTAFTKTFTDQIVIDNNRGKFLGSGDSGSLLVEDVTTNPRAVGLLFAGSRTYAIANPIDEVLAFFGGASMVGN